MKIKHFIFVHDGNVKKHFSIKKFGNLIPGTCQFVKKWFPLQQKNINWEALEEQGCTKIVYNLKIGYNAKAIEY